MLILSAEGTRWESDDARLLLVGWPSDIVA